MAHSVRAAASAVASLVILAALALPVAAADSATYLSHVNVKRQSVGLRALAPSALADQIAQERAAQLAVGGSLVHDFAYLETRLQASGTCYTSYAEVLASDLAAGFDSQATVDSWWTSPDHHAAIVGGFNVAGAGEVTSPAGVTYSVMAFISLCGTADPGPTSLTRLAGANRYATAAALSQSRFHGGAATVFIATGAAFPDALAGAPAAARAGGPILLTARDVLPAATAAELARLGPSTIVVLGGPAAVSDGVAAHLGAYAPNVVRWWGANRFETAAAISRHTFAEGVGVAYIATGRSFPDALSGGGLAGRDGGPILLVERDSIPAATAAELARLRPARIVVLGGTGPISEGVQAALVGHTPTGNVTRLAGSDRYATSVELSRAGYGVGGSVAAFIATGTNFPDGLAGGPIAALVPGPLLLVAPTQLPAVVAAELARLDPDTVYVIGGAGAISDGVVNAMDAAIP